jgi:hypothetical protein
MRSGCQSATEPTTSKAKASIAKGQSRCDGDRQEPKTASRLGSRR